ncbi:MAG TPA: DoxX family protein [Fibrobacteria bacterium]|nr:DoxX family protein [Fibrobacteria bacterium]
MNAPVSLGNTILDISRRFRWLPPLLARVTVGCVFFQAGLGKINNLDNVIGFFGSMGIPAPAFSAFLVAWIECLGGLLLLAGLGTRLIAVPLSIIMLVALFTAKAGDVTGFSALLGVSDYLYLVLLIWLMIAGPGRVALDALVARRYRQRL